MRRVTLIIEGTPEECKQIAENGQPVPIQGVFVVVGGGARRYSSTVELTLVDDIAIDGINYQKCPRQ